MADMTDEQIDALWRAPMSADWEHREFARAVLAAAVPPGCVVVPRESTREMVAAVMVNYKPTPHQPTKWQDLHAANYCKMINAALGTKP